MTDLIHDTAADGARRPGLAAFARIVSRAWALPPRRYRVTVRRRVPVPMSDGTILLADHYAPVTDRAVATVLVRCPYGRAFPYDLLCGQLVAERGYHVLLQSCRGTFGSGGGFDPFRHEAGDGQDTVAWLRLQGWFDGRLATYGMSYLGFVQWALAMDPPPELRAAVVQVGPHDFSRATYRNGVLDLQNFLGWSQGTAHQQDGGPLRALREMAGADRKIRPALKQLPLRRSARELLADRAPWFDGWLEHPDLSDEYWAPLQCGAALERLAVPTLLVGGWQDLFLEQTLEQYAALAAREVRVRLLVGPWAHLQLATGGEAVRESLAWLDRYLGDDPGSAVAEGPARIWVGEDGWRELPGWPPAQAREQRWYLGPRGALGPQAPAGQPGAQAESFRYDPADPTPSVGGAIMTRTAGAQDNSAVERRADLLVFTSAPLTESLQVIGAVIAELSVTRDNPHADLFVRLCDVNQRGRSRNVCDGIVRLTSQDPLAGTFRVSLLGTAHRFGPGHRLRLQVAGGAYPRYARNPGTGDVDATASELAGTSYRIGVGAPEESALVLAVVTD